MASTRWLYAWGLGAIAFGGASLLLPLYIIELGAEPFTLGVLAASAALAGAPGAFLIGIIADRTGRRRIFVLGALGVMGVMMALVPLLDSIPLVIAANAFVWLAYAAAGPVLTLLAVAGVDESEWQDRIALLNSYQGWGWAGGLVLGALWTGVGEQYLSAITTQRTFFLACATCSAGALFTARTSLPAESALQLIDPKQVRRAVLRARRLNLRGANFPFTLGRLFWGSLQALDPRTLYHRFSKGLVAYYGSAFLFFIGFTAFFAPLPLFLEEIGYGSGLIFGLYLLSSLGSASFFVGAASLSRTYNEGTLQSIGLGVRGVTFPSVALVGTVLGVALVDRLLMGGLFLVVGLTWAVIAVTAATIVTRLAPAAIRGEALGMYTAVSSVAGFLGSLLGGGLAERSYVLAFGTAGFFVVLGALLVYRLRHVSEADDSSSPNHNSRDSTASTVTSPRGSTSD